MRSTAMSSAPSCCRARVEGILTSARPLHRDSVFRVAGANPRGTPNRVRRAADAARARNTAAILELHVDDVDRVLERRWAPAPVCAMSPETLPTGDRVGALIDPFGHIWALFTATNESEVLDEFGGRSQCGVKGRSFHA